MQVNESINTNNFMAVGVNANKTTKTDEAGNADFASFLKTPKQQNNTSDSTKVSNFKQSDNNESRVKEQSQSTPVSKEQSRESNDVRKTDSPDNSKDVAEMNNNIDYSEDSAVYDAPSKEELEAVTEVIGDILQMIMNKFNLSFEELTSDMEQRGMDVTSLVTEDGIKDLFLDFNSADVSDLLTDEALSLDFQEFKEDFNQLLNNQSIPAEEIIDITENDMISIEDIGESMAKTDKSVSDIPKESAVSFDYVTDNEQNEVDNSPVVIVEDERSDNNTDQSKQDNTFSETLDKTDIPDSKEKHARTAESGESKKEFVNPILQGITDAVGQVEDISAPAGDNVRPVNVVEQIVEQVRVNINQENTSLEMQLYPEHLGRIQIHVVSKDGVMTARIAAETETAKQAIEAGLNNLKESLQNQNLKVDAIEVMVSTTGFADSDERQEQYEQQGTGNRGRRLGFSDIEEEDSDEEIDSQRMRAEGSSVSYRA